MGFTMADAIAYASTCATVIVALIGIIVAIIKFVPPTGLRNGKGAEVERLREWRHKVATPTLQELEIRLALVEKSAGIDHDLPQRKHQ